MKQREKAPETTTENLRVLETTEREKVDCCRLQNSQVLPTSKGLLKISKIIQFVDEKAKRAREGAKKGKTCREM